MSYNKNALVVSGSSALAALYQEGGLARYLAEIQKFPILTEKEISELAYKWQTYQDVAAANKLVTSHLRLVAKIALGYRGYGLPIQDIISEGNLGLMHAVSKFDPQKGSLATYAILWIKASIQDYILRSWSMVKIGTSAAQKALFFNLRKLKNRIQNMINSGEVVEDENALIAKELNVSKQDVIDMEMRFANNSLSLNDKVSNEDDSGELLEFIAESKDNQEIQLVNEDDARHKQKLFAAAMLELEPRERHILTERRLKEKPTTLDVLSKELNVSRERVRQIEEKAISKLKLIVAQQYEVGNYAT
jgi:RNA polymerase sigma-32 factor